MSTMSVIAALEAAGNAASRTSFARWDWGLLVGLPSVDSAPPNRAPITTTATTIAATQAPIVLRGCLAQASASLFSHVTFIGPLSCRAPRTPRLPHAPIMRPRGAARISAYPQPCPQILQREPALLTCGLGRGEGASTGV